MAISEMMMRALYEWRQMEKNMAEYDRFRSFAERYIVERASTFTKSKEREEAWAATLDAKTIYQNIARAAQDAEGPPQKEGVSSAGQHTNAPNPYAGLSKPITVRTVLPQKGWFDRWAAKGKI